MKRIFTFCSVALLALAFVMVVLFNWSSFGWQALSVPTGSMKPSIPPGSLVLVHRVPAETIKVGDVITYINPENPQRTITHRVMKTYMISPRIHGFYTKGDANKVPDIPVSSGSVKGKVMFHVPYLGAWMLWTRTPWGMLPFIWLPGLLIMIEEVRRLADYLKSLQPYRLSGFRPKVEQGSRASGVLAMGTTVSIVFVLLGVFLWQPALALLKSNTVALANNRLAIAPIRHHCSGNTGNNTSISINNSSSQTASSGNASVSGNTNGSSATSGSASTGNSTNVNITVTNCH